LLSVHIVHMQERQKHADVYEAYFLMGRDRSLEKLHDRWSDVVLNWTEKPPSVHTLKNWSKWFNWQERILLREKEIAKGVESKLIKAEINARAESIKNVKHTMDTLKATLASAFIKRDGKIILREDIKLKNAKELKEVTTAIFRGEEVLQRLIEPEESVNINIEGIKIIKVGTQTRDDETDVTEESATNG